MTNEEYQRQAAERSRQLDEARRRQGIEDANRHQREQAARNAQASKENYSRSLGSRGVAPPLLGPGVDRRTYDRAMAGYKAQQQSNAHMKKIFSPISGAGGGAVGSSVGGSRGRGGSSFGKFVLVLLVIGVVIVVFANQKPSPSSKGTSSDSASATGGSFAVDSNASKPSAANRDTTVGIPPVSETTTAVTNPDSSTVTSVDSTTQSAPQEATVGQAAQSVQPAQARWPVEGMSFAADRKGANNGCKGGTLVLEVSQLSFSCPSDSSKSVVLPLSEIKALDDDGIDTNRRGKYHFKFGNRDKTAVVQQFHDWWTRVNPVPMPTY